MELTLLYLGLFIVEAAGDYFSCIWHEARTERNLRSQVVIAMVLQLLTWIPVWLAITEQDPIIVVVSLLGTGFGNYLAWRKNSNPVVERTDIVR